MDRRESRPDLIEALQATHAGHPQVEEDDVRLLPLEHRECFRPRKSLADDLDSTIVIEDGPNRLEDELVVVDQEYLESIHVPQNVPLASPQGADTDSGHSGPSSDPPTGYLAAILALGTGQPSRLARTAAPAPPR